MSRFGRIGTALVIAGVAVLGLTALPGKAQAWWAGGWGCCRVGVGVVLPPVVLAPPVYAPPPVYYAPPPAYYAPPPAYYAPPQRVWVPAHWQGNVWVPGHWA